MTDDRDDWLYRELESARRLEPTASEVEPVLAAVESRRVRRRVALGGRTMGVALTVLAIVAGAAAAATGLVSIGGVIDGAGFRGDKRQVVKETVTASGTTKGVGAWRITSFTTKEGTPCLKLTLLDRAARMAPGPVVSGYCGGVAAFAELGHGRRAAALARGEVVLFGTAPAAARRVELTGSPRTRVVTPTRGGPGASERFWVLAAPVALNRATVAWFDGGGRPRGMLDVGYRFAGPLAPTVVATGTTPAAGPWRLSTYESRRLANAGDVYSPEGLPCLDLRLLDPREGHPSGGGFCGVQPTTPGFTRGQSRYPNMAGRPQELILYGHAPERADAVEVRAGGRTISTPTIAPPPGIPGRFWLLARPPEDFAGGHVQWVDRDGGARGRPVEVLPP
jgi:hypothetical protein